MLKSQAREGTGEARPRLLVRPLELREACDEELCVVERDERALEARAAQEPHGRGVELLGVLPSNQDEQRRRLVEPDVRQIPSGHASREQVAAGESATETGQRRSLSGHEHLFVADRRAGKRPG
jgi:hypothetical protein